MLSRLFKGVAMSAKKKAPTTATMVLDPALPLEHRKQMLMQLCMTPDPACGSSRRPRRRDRPQNDPNEEPRER